jgi:hypothetical protein
LEQENEEKRSNETPVEEAASCSNRENVEADPDGLLCEIVRVARNGPEA